MPRAASPGASPAPPVYAETMRGGEGEQEQLRALVEGERPARAGADMAVVGNRSASSPVEAFGERAA